MMTIASRTLIQQMSMIRSITNTFEDASNLNLEYVAQCLLNKDDTVITVGVDDTKKVDVKSDRISIIGMAGEKKTPTTGYVQNPSHSGDDSARTYEFQVSCLALSTKCDVDDIKSQTLG